MKQFRWQAWQRWWLLYCLVCLQGSAGKLFLIFYHVACYLFILTSKGTNLHPRRRIPLNAETPILIN